MFEEEGGAAGAATGSWGAWWSGGSSLKQEYIYLCHLFSAKNFFFSPFLMRIFPLALETGCRESGRMEERREPGRGAPGSREWCRR